MENKSILCPLCKRKVATWDKKSKIDIATNCRNCKIRVIFRVETEKTEIRAIPPRSCSSGMTF